MKKEEEGGGRRRRRKKKKKKKKKEEEEEEDTPTCQAGDHRPSTSRPNLIDTSVSLCVLVSVLFLELKSRSAIRLNKRSITWRANEVLLWHSPRENGPNHLENMEAKTDVSACE